MTGQAPAGNACVLAARSPYSNRPRLAHMCSHWAIANSGVMIVVARLLAASESAKEKGKTKCEVACSFWITKSGFDPM
jgi:hypothetical protein